MTGPADGIAAGYEFTHDQYLDPAWRPGPGQRYEHAPHAPMVVTRATKTTVWYGYRDWDGPGQRSGWRMDRAEFAARYGPA